MEKEEYFFLHAPDYWNVDWEEEDRKVLQERYNKEWLSQDAHVDAFWGEVLGF